MCLEIQTSARGNANSRYADHQNDQNDSVPKSKVGTYLYVAPEVIAEKNYDGKVGISDVASTLKLEYILVELFHV